MEELRTIILKQNEVLKRLEDALSSAINRIEGIEKLYLNSEGSVLLDYETQTLPKVSGIEKSKKKLHPSINRMNESHNFDSNAIVSAPTPQFEINVHSNQSLSFIKNGENPIMYSKAHTPNSHIFSTNSIMKYYSNPNTLECNNSFENSNNALVDDLDDTQVLSLSRSIKHDNTLENNENDANVSNINKLRFFSARNGLAYDEGQGLSNNFTQNVEFNGLNALDNYTCKRTILPNTVGRNIKHNLSSKLFIFDEEDRSNMRPGDPQDLEIAENEFYYLKGHIKRGSASNDQLGNYNLDNCRLFKCLYPPSDHMSSHNVSIRPFGFYINSNISQIEKDKCSIKEIIYHKPSEKVIGYVQIPYNAILSQHFDCSKNNQPNGYSAKKLEFVEHDSREDNNHLKAEIFTSNYDQFNKKRVYTMGEYPIFYRFFYFQKYPILILRPLI
ncbi:hypothetical protein OJ253_3166 [Cryptosporidium canis]|uniref:Uncharacterized protein n=1 Tax=Cryptosporidium canis TaxID=195482 RepID=A0A9D5DJ70_9CRYT|nr:hypothetical protein OJ253_3166 [Cryptosporidium canis]